MHSASHTLIQVIESTVLGATDIMLLAGNGDHSHAIHTVSQAMDKSAWIVGYGLTIAAELKQSTKGLATYVDLTRHLDSIIFSPQSMGGANGQVRFGQTELDSVVAGSWTGALGDCWGCSRSLPQGFIIGMFFSVASL